MKLVMKFSKIMQDEFKMSLMGELNYFLGIHFKKLDKGTFVCQTKYSNDDLLKRFGMEDANSIDTLMPINGNMERNGNGKDVDVKKYIGMIVSLLYLTASKSDIMFSVCMYAHYQSDPKKSHLKVVKHILRYLHGTSKYVLWYSKGSDCNLVGIPIPIFLVANQIGRVLMELVTHFQIP
ncbi:uncharacterized protein LOC127123078 [Lathyrus oleraceus]|uniref:uncharacterized protein LOC127123078 n=1 Tax=Pisum sativum TaxID=3888 RepID=UPI0021D07217|nr:uncharacterized protein LOC127123078 [Pisum sativum]